MQVKFVLSRQIVVTDPSPSPYLQVDATLAQAFRTKFEAAFPGQVLNLDTPDQMISPNDRVIVVVPTLAAVRMADEVKAGSIHNMEAFVVGDISAVDPWTDANLFSATRMVSTNFLLGQSEISGLDAKAREAFWNSANRWLDATVEQLRTKLSPFVLDGVTLSPPDKAKKFRGGIWPFGALRGLKVGQTLNGGPGKYAKVTAVFPKFCLVEDVADPGRVLPAGERYTLTLVDKPTERPEPSVALSWVGGPPSAPEGMDVAVLSSEALVGLFDNYLSKGGGLKILPPKITNPRAKEQLNKLAQEVSSRSKLVAGNLGTFERENLVIRAAENPDRIIEIGVMERYRGTRTKADGTVESYYRITLAGAVRERIGREEAPMYALSNVVRHSEELALVEAKGIREADAADTFFTLSRNGVIRLAKKVREVMATGQSSGEIKEVPIGPGGLDWKGAQPSAFTPLTWLRPSGEIKGPDGTSLGVFYQIMAPSQGYLNVSIAPKEKLEAGDVLRFSTATAAGEPIVALKLGDSPGYPPWFPSQAWVLRFAGKFLGQSSGAQMVPVAAAEDPGLEAQKLVNLGISALGATAQGSTINYTGQWRCQVFGQDSDPSAAPLLKFGIQSDAPVSIQGSSAPLQPPDLGGWGLQYTIDAVKKLAEAGAGNGFKQAISKPN
jgi:hypothetical protein